MRGDILFYVKGTSLSDRLISHFTKGPFVHVEVDVGDGVAIGAHTDGVKARPILPNGDFLRFPLPAANESRLEDGLRFLHDQVGNGYGFIDIVNQGLKVLRSPVYLAALDQYDCSDLVARYVAIVGGSLQDCLGPLAEEPHMVTPNDLGRAAGLITDTGELTVHGLLHMAVQTGMVSLGPTSEGDDGLGRHQG